MVKLNDTAPNFVAHTSQGLIDFYSYMSNSWAILFSHPKNFTPVCTTELGALQKLLPEFTKRDVKVIGLSVDAIGNHDQWLNDIQETQGAKPEYPLIADEDKKVSKLYDMIHENASDTMTVRSVFIVGPDKKIKLKLEYPASTGRNFNEILRVIDSLQLTYNHKVATPANWVQGEEVILTSAISNEEANEKFPGFKTIKPYLRTSDATFATCNRKNQ
jgi:alkyl hydroperoxide reductase subunit AhpC